MKIFGPTVIAAAVLMSPGAITEAWQQHQLNARAFRAGEALSGVYIRTESESIHIASSYAFSGKICVALSLSGPAFQSGDESAKDMSYVVFDSDGHSYRYNLSHSEFDGECGGASSRINILRVVERGAQGDQ